jgi:DNA polymerase-3 subunit gamma/tau
VTIALYRRYRPDTFAEVIGQSHVTEPLQQALRTDRVSHAYLFSGPRGCGKTTSARILARCLNCVEGPTDTPCGRCDSCLDLARGGSGRLDVVEIDAASHNGVDDARDLRERAAYAPARDRYKIFILDEAHMVTTQGFNALLKIVEEPPPHVKFIFATTEPDKVIGTIRSRTHHYPFRLVPPEILQTYLEQICASEGVPVGPGVLPLVVRAGAGSVRDSLSVLDQLVAGAADTGVDYERAVALLGYTPAALLDDTVDALSARDGASVFRVVDRVISTGHEPRRFVEDLLERLRDLIVIAAAGDAADAVLRNIPADQLAGMRTQAAHLGMGELSRAADMVNAALSEMTGATSPRLHLELLCARLLLPAADDGTTGHGARLDRLERQVSGGVGVELSSAVAAPSRLVAPAPVVPAPVVPAPAASEPTGALLETELLRRRWPEVLETVSRLRKVTRALVDQQNAKVASLTNDTLRLSFTTAALAATFRGGHHAEIVQQAVRETLGFDVRVEGHLEEGSTDPVRPDRSAAPRGWAPVEDQPEALSTAPVPPAPVPPAPDLPTMLPPLAGAAGPTGASGSDWPEVATPGGRQTTDNQSNRTPAPAPAPAPAPRSDGRGERGGSTTVRGSRSAAARSGSSQAPPAARSSSVARPSPGPADEEPDHDERDAPIVEESGLTGAPLVAQLLGGTVIDEVVDGPA